MTARIAAELVERGGEVAMPPSSDPALGYRFELDGEIVEVLAPDGLRKNPPTVGRLTTFQVPGGTQALRRTEVVDVALETAPPVGVRRPNLLGAILIKARAVAAQREEKLASDRQDLIRLLSYVEDPRGLAEEEGLKQSERKWLRGVEGLVDFEDGRLGNQLTPAVRTRAEQAFLLLAGP